MLKPSVDIPEIVGRSPAIQRAKELAELYAPIGDPLLLSGPTGAGKGAIARALHARSGHRGRFVHLSGGHLVETLYQSQLFGSVRGAYTGSLRDARGAFEQAADGTLFLDELPLWSLAAQGAVLQAVEEGWVLPLGAVRELRVNCRVLIGTNQPLERLAAQGRLLEDLWYRIGEFVIPMPPLAERRVDIAVLAYYFLDKEVALAPRTTPPVIGVDALDRLLSYDWPGNVRQLRSAIRYACVHAQGEQRIERSHLPPVIAARRRAVGPAMLREITEWVFEESGGNQRRAARRLGVHPNTIGNRMRTELG